MNKRLALFEFISFHNIVDFRALVTDIVNSLKAIQENISRLDKTDIDVYAPVGVRAKLRTKARELLMRLHHTLQVNPKVEAIHPDVAYLEDLLYILSHFKSEAEICVEIKAILEQAKKIYPDPEKLFNQAPNPNRGIQGAAQITPLDPEMPTTPYGS